MMNRASNNVKKELDLRKFLIRQRMLLISVLSLLKEPQYTFARRFSQPILFESSDTTPFDSDSEVSETEKQTSMQMENLSKVINLDRDLTNKRLIKLFQAHNKL